MSKKLMANMTNFYCAGKAPVKKGRKQKWSSQFLVQRVSAKQQRDMAALCICLPLQHFAAALCWKLPPHSSQAGHNLLHNHLEGRRQVFHIFCVFY